MHDKIQDEFYGIQLSFDYSPIVGCPLREFVLSRHDLLVMLAQSWQQLYEIIQEDLQFVDGLAQFPLKNSSPNEWLDFAQLLVQGKHHSENTPKVILDVGGRKIFVRVPSDRYAYDMGELPLYSVRSNLPIRQEHPGNNSIVVVLNKNDFPAIRDPNQEGHEPLKNQQAGQRFTYPDIMESLTVHYGADLDDRVIIQQCRHVLSGHRLQAGHAKVIPLMLAIMFGSEVSRNRACLVTGIMLMDLIEARIKAPTLGDDKECYTLANSLWHPKLYGTTKKERTQNPILHALSLLGGFHPMAHLDSWKGEFKDEGPYQQNKELTTAHVKSIMILIDWLCHLEHPILQGVSITKLHRDQYLVAKEKAQQDYFNQRDEGIKHLALTGLNNSIIAKFLFPLINDRLSSFDCMLATSLERKPVMKNEYQVLLDEEAKRREKQYVEEYERQRNRFFDEARKLPVIDEVVLLEIDQINDAQSCIEFMKKYNSEITLDKLNFFTQNAEISHKVLAELVVKLSLLKPPYSHSLTTLMLNLKGAHWLTSVKLVLCTSVFFNQFKTQDTEVLVLLRQLSLQLPLHIELTNLLLSDRCVVNHNQLSGTDLFEIVKQSRDEFLIALMVDTPDLFRKIVNEVYQYEITGRLAEIIPERLDILNEVKLQKIVEQNYGEIITAMAQRGLELIRSGIMLDK